MTILPRSTSPTQQLAGPTKGNHQRARNIRRVRHLGYWAKAIVVARPLEIRNDLEAEDGTGFLPICAIF